MPYHALVTYEIRGDRITSCVALPTGIDLRTKRWQLERQN